MSVLAVRGGLPQVFLLSATTVGFNWPFKWITNYLVMRAATFPCKVFFTEADFDADTNYLTVPVAAAATPHGEWRGPAEVQGIWVKGVGGTSVLEVTAFQRRG